jgi:AAA15 family ATPase/GTPase
MDAFGIENLRCLADTGLIALKPLTILVGQNSSGKSTFLRALPLLRQSVESRTTGPMLWYGRWVDFGSFHEAIRSEADQKEIVFKFQFNLTKLGFREKKRPSLSPDFLTTELSISVIIKVTEDLKQGMTRMKECHLSFAGHHIKMAFDNEEKVISFKVNELDVLALAKNQPFYAKFKYLMPSIEINYFDPKTELTEIKNLSHIILLNDKSEISSISIAALDIGSSEAMLANMQKHIHTRDKTFKSWTIHSEGFKTIRDHLLAFQLEGLLRNIDDYLAAFTASINYIGPVRATAERYYRIQDFAVDEIDSQGKNLAMLLRNFTAEEGEQFAEWTQKYFDVRPTFQSTHGHFSIKLAEKEGKTAFNLDDTGFGFSQVLPIITELWRLSHQPTQASQHMAHSAKLPLFFAIEQPELHLHPSLQAKLADTFLATIEAARQANIDLRLIIETHSETIINRLGHRIASGDAKRQDITVAIFEKEEANAPAQVTTAEYDEEGFLTNWPFGFFEPDII